MKNQDKELCMNQDTTITEEYIHRYIDTMMEKNFLTEEEQKQFIQTSVVQQLDPFRREIYAIKYEYYSKKTNKYETVFNLVTGYEVYLKRANASGVLAGWKVEDQLVNGEVKACITIHRKDWSFPFYHEVWLKEYRSDKELWRTKPITMIKKIAMSQGFRLAFPIELGGLIYTAEEMSSSYNNDNDESHKQEIKTTTHIKQTVNQEESEQPVTGQTKKAEDQAIKAEELPSKEQISLINKVIKHCQYNPDQVLCLYDAYKVHLSGPQTKKQASELLRAWADPETKAIDYSKIKEKLDLFVFGELQTTPAKEVLSWEDQQHTEEELEFSK